MFEDSSASFKMDCIQYMSSVAPDQRAQLRNMVRSYRVRCNIRQGFVVLLANMLATDQTTHMCRLVWSYAGCIWHKFLYSRTQRNINGHLSVHPVIAMQFVIATKYNVLISSKRMKHRNVSESNTSNFIRTLLFQNEHSVANKQQQHNKQHQQKQKHTHIHADTHSHTHTHRHTHAHKMGNRCLYLRNWAGNHSV